MIIVRNFVNYHHISWATFTIAQPHTPNQGFETTPHTLISQSRPSGSWNDWYSNYAYYNLLPAGAIKWILYKYAFSWRILFLSDEQTQDKGVKEGRGNQGPLKETLHSKLKAWHCG